MPLKLWPSPIGHRLDGDGPVSHSAVEEMRCGPFGELSGTKSSCDLEALKDLEEGVEA